MNTYPDFLWRFAKSCHVVAQIQGAAGEADKKKDLLFQVRLPVPVGHVDRRTVMKLIRAAIIEFNRILGL